jgi:putative endonuclease
MTWFVYLLECSDGSYYTGITNNLDRRIKQHNKGKGAKYTKGRGPVILKCYLLVATKSEALKIEYKIKKLSRSEKLKYFESNK